MKDHGYRVHGSLLNTDVIMNNAFWLGVYPALNTQQLTFVAESVKEFYRQNFAFMKILTSADINTLIKFLLKGTRSEDYSRDG